MNPLNVKTSSNSSSSEDLEDLCIEHDIVDLDEISVAPRKPHFLDYDAIPPPGFEETVIQKTNLQSSTSGGYSGENVKVDKKYEIDGEISDYEVSASGITKKEVNMQRESSQSSVICARARKKKHFLDENPIPPDYMLDKEREHRSLDRNFERKNEYERLYYERKHSLDREISQTKFKEPSYMLSRFTDGDIASTYRGTWPVDKLAENSISFASVPSENLTTLGSKVECVYSLLSMLGSYNSVEMSKKFLELSRSSETCTTLRRSGCIPLLVQIMHSDADERVRKRVALALHNVVHCHPDDKVGRREAKVLRLIEQIMEYCNFLKTHLQTGGEVFADDSDRHPLAAISSLMKVSFDEEHRHAMCQLGALQAIASLLHLDHAVHGPKPDDQCCNSLRRYALMALTNLTFGDGNNKALLCGNKEFMEALVAQLDFAPDDLLQVTASVLRNLSWRADNNMKAVLNEIGTVTALTKAAMKNKNENTLKAILSALWNLSAHCSTNKGELCAVEGALAFLVDMLIYEGPSRTLKIIENAGGILRNISSHIAVREVYRNILRQRNCLGILLQQLKSESLTVVSNACGTLWNLSARCPEDQKYLWENGAVPMLRSLIHSKHKMISEGSSAALKNLLNFRPGAINPNNFDPIARSMGLKELPTLTARKQKAFDQELNKNLAETCDNLDAITPPQDKKDFLVHTEEQVINTRESQSRPKIVSISDNKDSKVPVTKSDSLYEKSRRETIVPACNEINEKDINASNVFSIRNNFVESGFEVEIDTEQPIDYSAKYNNEFGVNQKSVDESNRPPKNMRKNDARNYSTYQETDLDQLTDFSLRYAENQGDSDSDDKATINSANEIILILEDSVKCYQTEGTPYAISNATSVTDLRNSKIEEPVTASKPILQKSDIGNSYGSGTYTPEKPTNYCEEGTPGYFSRYESLSSLDESPPNYPSCVKVRPDVLTEEKHPTSSICETSTVSTKYNNSNKGDTLENPIISLLDQNSKTSASANSAQETPLMFSRRSSMDSLTSVEPNTADDKSSVVSDFSRLASGIMSPSEIPDSPTQSMPQSPRRISNSTAIFPPASSVAQKSGDFQRLRSVFEDDINTFQDENTPAHFSCATSLSNLSLEDEPKIATDALAKKLVLTTFPQSEDKSILEVNPTENNETQNSSPLTEEEEEGETDDIVLAACINIGMNRGTSTAMLCHSLLDEKDATPSENAQLSIVSNSNDDVLTQYHTEDTSALLSKVGSTSNLNVLSTYPRKYHTTNSSYGRSYLSCSGANELVKFSEALPEKNIGDPIAMLKSGGLPLYFPVGDEISKFNVEDSPCNFSVISGLSDLTVESQASSYVKGPDIVNPTDIKLQKKAERQSHDDSMSSISVESEEDNNILSQVIAAGVNKVKSAANPSFNLSFSGASKKFQTNEKNTLSLQGLNDSYSSIDSSDSNDVQAKSLLEQCIRTGMEKTKKIGTSHKKPITSPKRSQLPSLNLNNTARTPLKNNRERQRERERKDEQLLMECITTGIHKTVRTETLIKPPTRHLCQVLGPTEFNQRVKVHKTRTQIDVPKNEESTSVAVLEQQQVETAKYQCAHNTVPGVGRNVFQGGTNHESKNHIPHEHVNMRNRIGYEDFNIEDKIPIVSHNDDNLSNSCIRSEELNEYPGLKTSTIDYSEQSVTDASFEMDISNEFLIDHNINDAKYPFSKTTVFDKHKDPDLMLKSVERLTQELVSTAEYLRTASASNVDNSKENESNSTNDKKSESNSNSNNTWNEDTCPNDVSFPSLSLTAPMITSINDEEATISDAKPYKCNEIKYLNEITPTNEINTFPLNEGSNYSMEFIIPDINGSQPNSLETDTDTLVNEETDEHFVAIGNSMESYNNGIKFRVGGEVKRTYQGTINQYHCSGPISIHASSGMTNSTAIAMEADKLANDLIQNMCGSTKSLDLDNIRPPSVMECLSMSGCFETPQSPLLSHLNKKSLPAGLMARRAICSGQQALSGSVESINSSCNLDNVKPPSLMDDLLDSMISVASITSEIVDHSLGTPSNYETAFSDVDENTTTLQSCMNGFLSEDSNGTPIPSDFSSAESTPRKHRSANNNVIGGVRRVLTPKQKRRVVQDRYKTYTIAADFVLKDNINNETVRSDVEYLENDEFIQVAIRNDCMEITTEQTNNIFPTTPSFATLDDSSSINRRHLNPDRFKTRTIFCNSEDGRKNIKERSSTQNEHECMVSTNDNTDEVLLFPNIIKQSEESGNCGENASLSPRDDHINENEDYNSIDFEQNSETESCDQDIHKTEDNRMQQREIKPRILKQSDKHLNGDSTGMLHEEALSNSLKVVRGKKRASYVSPYKKSVTNTHPVSPKHQFSSVANTRAKPKAFTSETKKDILSKQISKNQTCFQKTHVFINRSSLASKISTIKSSFTKNVCRGKAGDISVENKRDIPKNNMQNEINVALPHLERQGTFVKPNTTHEGPIVTSLPSTPVKSKLPTRSQKISNIQNSPNRYTTQKLKNPVPKNTNKTVNNIRLSPAKLTTDLRRTTPIRVHKFDAGSSVAQRSNSNTSLRTAPTVSALRTDLPSTTPPSRSNSNLTNPRINVSSRIAGLWKKPSEPKNSLSNSKSTKDKTQSKLVRSLTFDNSPLTAGSSSGVQKIVEASNTKIAQQKTCAASFRGTKNKKQSGEMSQTYKRVSKVETFLDPESNYKATD